MTDIADKTLETVLVNIIEKVTSGVDKAIEFSAEQLPDIVQQLILFNTIYLTVLVLLGCIGIGIYTYAAYKVFSEEDRDAPLHTTETGFPIVLFGLFPLTGSVALLFSNLGDLLKITLAPKIWLIEYAAGLVK